MHKEMGTRTAILVGDYMFAQSSWHLANLENIKVIKMISQVIKDFASGEIRQANSLFDTEATMADYEERIFRKTATLISASCASAAVFSECSEQVKDEMYEFGKRLGMAFQAVDDLLDFTQSEEQLGKPQGQDLAQGNVTAPVIFAIEERPELASLIDSEFEEEGSFQRALSLIKDSDALDRTRQFARSQGDAALRSLRSLPHCDARRSLEFMVDYVLDRIN